MAFNMNSIWIVATFVAEYQFITCMQKNLHAAFSFINDIIREKKKKMDTF